MFTKIKFQKFSIQRQHKKCAELLKSLYERMLSHQATEEVLEHYHQLQMWMNSTFKLTENAKQIADRYHFHLKLAYQNLLEHNLLPSIRQGDRKTSEVAWPISIYLDGLRSAHNVGSILRTVEAFALGEVYFSEQCPTSDNKKVQDASMGAHAWISCKCDKKPQELPRPLIALKTSFQAISLYEFIFPESFTLVVGNEEYGCSDDILKLADFMIEIPLRGRKNSLNVANAFAITASEIQRQRAYRQMSPPEFGLF